MILLSVQIQCILYHLLAGWIYGLCFSFLQTLTQYHQKNMLTVLSEILFHAAFSAGMFFGLLFVNGAVSNIYLVLFFMLGVFFYYRFYYRLFYHFFTFVRHFFHKRFHKIAVAKSRMLGIIKKNTKKGKKSPRKHLVPWDSETCFCRLSSGKVLTSTCIDLNAITLVYE